MSPKIFRNGGLSVVIYTRDHLPPHVHVFNADGECVINLGDNFRAPSVRQVEGMRDRDVVRAFRLVQENQHPFLIRWREIHGS